MYEFKSRVRYSEVDAEGKMKISALVNYLQDSSSFQSEDKGVGVDYLSEHHIAWVINYWQIDITKIPKFGEEIIIGTIPYLIKGFLGFRNYYIRDAATGEMIVKANSVWTLIDVTKIMPVKADEMMYNAYNETVGKLDMEYTDRKIFFDTEGSPRNDIVIMKHHIDTNHHVNNEQYIAMALEFLPEGRKITRIRTEYKKSAYLNDVLTPYVHDGESFTGVEFKKDGEKDALVKCAFEFE